MYECFSLVLTVTHACNLRCSYCYAGSKRRRAMGRHVGRTAVERAVRSIRPGGTLELGFFGGEPLLEAELILELADYASRAASQAGVDLQLGMTTNGTLLTDAAWEVMTLPAMRLTVSHDGLPEVHDRHRRGRDGRGTSAQVLATICRLLDAPVDLGVNMVVRPETVARLPEGIAWLHEQGVRHFDVALDLWTRWQREDSLRLQEALALCADYWYAGLPELSVSWFDEKAARLAGLPANPTARCGFGDGEIAVAPSGNLYPCERLIGEDTADNPMQLPGHALDREDFCRPSAPERSADGCASCAIQSQCGTTCRCSNYVRTGDIRKPDGLLCALDQILYRETVRVLRKLPIAGMRPSSPFSVSSS
ncbi:MAG: radical SAM protein [Pirellulales bacterium]|nr:radical SAM protein [Pirellulales bacterium]